MFVDFINTSRDKKKSEKNRLFEVGSLFWRVEHGRRDFRKIAIFGYVHCGRYKTESKTAGSTFHTFTDPQRAASRDYKTVSGSFGTLWLRFYGHLTESGGWRKGVKMAVLEGPKYIKI